MSNSTATDAKPYNFVDAIIDFESGDLESDQIIELFQNLIDSGKITHLQGSYRRIAQGMIENGTCTPRA